MHTDNAEATKDTHPAKSDAAEAVCEAYPLSVPVEREDQTLPLQTGTCDCCEQTDIPAPDLTPIESGQLLCPDCLMALHLDISRIEAEAFTDSHA